jgi:hypothetical protein
MSLKQSEARLLLHDIMVFCLLYYCPVIAVPCTGAYLTQPDWRQCGWKRTRYAFFTWKFKLSLHWIYTGHGSQADMLVLQQVGWFSFGHGYLDIRHPAVKAGTCPLYSSELPNMVILLGNLLRKLPQVASRAKRSTGLG